MALDIVRIAGLPSTAPYLRHLLDEPDFAKIRHDTSSLEHDWAPAPADRLPPAGSPQPQRGRREVQVPWGGRSIAITVHGAFDKPGTAAPVRTARAAAATEARAQNGDPTIGAPMDGVVVGVNCVPGQAVCKGDQLLLLEVMKMEVVIPAPRDGVLDRVLVTPSDVVRSGTALVALRFAESLS